MPNMDLSDPVVKELQAARIKLIIDWPIFGSIVLHLDLKEVDWCSTAATDGKHFYYNREFVKRLSKPQLLFLTAHETLHCFPAGTIIPGMYKPIEEFVAGDHVIGQHGHSKTVIPMSRHYDGEIISIKGRGLLPLKLTPEHPILISRPTWKNVIHENGKRRNIREWSASEWTLAGEAKKGDWIHIPRIEGNIHNHIINFDYQNSWSVSDKIKTGVALDCEIADFLGWYVAEGSTTKVIAHGRKVEGDKIQHYNFVSAISLNINERHIAEKLQYILGNRFGITASIKENIETNSCRVLFASNPLGKWLWNNCGHTDSDERDSHHKRIPTEILYNIDDDILKTFMASYIERDGHVKSSVNFGTSSKVLALQMQIAFARFGILCNIYERKPFITTIREKEINCGVLYHGTTAWKEAFNLIGKETKAIRSTRWSGLTNDSVLTPIIEVNREPFSGMVYNMETSCHTYAAGNIMTHNCIFDHIFRRGSRNKDLWNMACDYIVNFTLVNTNDSHGKPIGTIIENVAPVTKVLYDVDYTDEFSVEELYALLEKNCVQIQPSLDMHLDGDGDGEEDKDGKPKEGQGKPGACADDDQEGNGKGRMPKLTQEEKDAIRDNIRASLIQAAQQQANLNPGSVPAGIQRLIDRLLEPKIDWRQMLDNVLRSSIKYDYTYTRRSRRSYTTNLILPGRNIMDKVTATAWLDGSGSTTQEMVTDFLTECKGIMNTFRDFELTIGTFDTEVYSVMKYTPDNADEIDDYPFKGGGGTAPSCCWRYMEENELVPHKILLFTDGYVGSDWGVEDYADTLFIVHSNPSAMPPYGKVVHYEPRR